MALGHPQLTRLDPRQHPRLIPACSPPVCISSTSPNPPACSHSPSLEAVGALPPCTGLLGATLSPLNPDSNQRDSLKGAIHQILTPLCLKACFGSRVSSPSLSPQPFHNLASITSPPTRFSLTQAASALLLGSLNLPQGLCTPSPVCTSEWLPPLPSKLGSKVTCSQNRFVKDQKPVCANTHIVPTVLLPPASQPVPSGVSVGPRVQLRPC